MGRYSFGVCSLDNTDSLLSEDSHIEMITADAPEGGHLDPRSSNFIQLDLIILHYICYKHDLACSTVFFSPVLLDTSS